MNKVLKNYFTYPTQQEKEERRKREEEALVEQKPRRTHWYDTAATLCYQANQIAMSTIDTCIVTKRDKAAFKEAVAQLRKIVEKMEAL